MRGLRSGCGSDLHYAEALTIPRLQQVLDRIEQAGVVALLAAQGRDSRAAQQTLHGIGDALAALRARRASLWAVSPS